MPSSTTRFWRHRTVSAAMGPHPPQVVLTPHSALRIPHSPLGLPFYDQPAIF